MKRAVRRFVRRVGASWKQCSFRPQQYWNARHAQLRGSIRATGHLGFSETENRASYVTKVDTIKEVILKHTSVPEGTTLLDAGCGSGVFSSVFEEMGFSVTGLDFSDCAVSQAQERLKGRYLVADLADLRLDEAFDWVVCIDVLLHLVDDRKWRRTLGNLTAHVREGGFLLIQDTIKEVSQRRADHVKWRTFQEYKSVFSRMGVPVWIEKRYDLIDEGVQKSILLAQGSRPTHVG